MNNIEFNLLCEKFAIPEEAKVRRNLLCLESIKLVILI